MGSSILFQGLRSSITKSTAQLSDARTRHAALAPYATAHAILDALAASSPLSFAERDAILAALVAEHERAPRSIWSSLLAAAFEPMLRKLASRVHVEERDEAEQRAIVAFLEILGQRAVTRATENVAGYLRVATESALFRGIKAERKGPPTVPLDDKTEVESLAVAEADRIDDARRAELLARVVRAEDGGDEMLDMLIATTRGNGETLEAYVARVHTGATDAERRVVYLTMRAAKKKILPRVRAAFRAAERSVA